MGSDITVNLNGHQIAGEGGLVVAHQGAGVRVVGQSNVVITNGTLRDFYHGVRATQRSGNRITAVRVLDNRGGNGIVRRTRATTWSMPSLSMATDASRAFRSSTVFPCLQGQP